MSAILHSIVVGIENDRIKEQINYWRWKSSIYYNKKLCLREIEKKNEGWSDVCHKLLKEHDFDWDLMMWLGLC